jgi:hypothetical protein
VQALAERLGGDPAEAVHQVGKPLGAGEKVADHQHPLSAGVHLLPVAISVAVGSAAGTRLAVRLGTKAIVAAGLGLRRATPTPTKRTRSASSTSHTPSPVRGTMTPTLWM